MNQEELHWRQYEKHIDLYRFYLEIVVKINAFHYAISGAIFSFYFANKDVASIKWAIALPALLSLCMAVLFAYGAYANLVTRKDVFNLAHKMGLEVAPELMVLTVLLVIFCLAHILTFGGAIYVLCA